MIKKLKKYTVPAALGVLGLFAGYAYWFYIGCQSGACAITSSPVNSSAYGALLGVLTGNLFVGKSTHSDDNKSLSNQNTPNS